MWFHATQRDLGQTPILDPMKAGENWGGSFRATPRVAVAPTPGQCIAAIGIPKQGDIFIYAVEAEHGEPTTPEGSIDDIKVTGERWFTAPIQARLVRKIDGETLRTSYRPFVTGFPSPEQEQFILDFKEATNAPKLISRLEASTRR